MDLQSEFSTLGSGTSCLPVLSYDTISVIAIVSSLLGVLWTAYQLLMLRRIDLQAQADAQGEEELMEGVSERQRKLLLQFGYKTYDAALQFLKLQYLLCLVLIIVSFLLIWFLTELALPAALAFLVGSLMSVILGVVTLLLTTRSAPKAAYCCKFGIGAAFRTSYQAASAVGFGIASLNLLAITVAIDIYKESFGLANSNTTDNQYFRPLFEAVAGYGLGASLVALVVRTGGSIFEAGTEAGSELIGQIEGALPFEHPKNAATIALHAGHQAQGVVGSSSDLVGTYAQLTCVTFLLSSTSLIGWKAQQDTSCGVNLATQVLPLLILSFGLVASLFVSMAGVIFTWVQSQSQLSRAIHLQRVISTALMAGLLYLSTYLSMPASFKLQGVSGTVNIIHASWEAYFCAVVGAIAHPIMGLLSQFLTSSRLPFVRALANQSRRGAPSALTLGLAFGYLASFGPIIIVCLLAFYGYELLGFYGIGLTLMGFISIFPIQLALQTLGPIADDAAISVSIAALDQDTKETSRTLQAVSFSTAKAGRGIAMGCSTLIGIVLFGGFLRNANLDTSKAQSSISLTDPEIFSGLLLGGIYPFIMAGLTVRGARKCIGPLMAQVRAQLAQVEGNIQDSQIDYADSVRPAAINTAKHLIAPVLLAILAILIPGLGFSHKMVAGLLPGVIVSGAQFAISVTTSGQAWKSARKAVQMGEVAEEDGRVNGVGSPVHKALCIGNLVGVSINKNASYPVICGLKLMGMLGVLFGSKFAELHSSM